MVEWYSRDKGLFNPRESAVDLPAELAVMCFTEGFYPRLVKCLGLSDARPAPEFGGCQKGRLGKDIMLFRSEIGAPAAAMAMEVIIASGVKRILMMGVAGSLSPTCPVGSYVIPTTASPTWSPGWAASGAQTRRTGRHPGRSGPTPPGASSQQTWRRPR